MIQKNILLQKMRQDAVDIFNEGLLAVNPKDCIHHFCGLENNILTVESKSYDLDNFDKILVLGAGKAGASMASAIEEILHKRIAGGMVIVKYGHVDKLKKVKIIEAGHPVPDSNGVEGAKKLLKMVQSADSKTLIICLISGGGSALMSLPAKGISLIDKQQTTQTLLGCGASIHEINTIRKHISMIKGGLFAKAAFPAAMICFVLSDVVGDDLDIISSGPCVPDLSTFGQCLEIIEKYKIKNNLPETVLLHLENGVKGLIPETPDKQDKIFKTVYHKIIASNIDALKKAEQKAKSLGYNSLILSSMIEGQTRDAAIFHTAIAKQIITTQNPVKKPACILSGGETTITLKGKGKGGRNQEFALACAFEIKGQKNVVVLSAGTDGTDGPTDAAGAIVDHTTILRAKALDLNAEQFFRDNNAYHFFDQLSDLLKTGATNTNVMDLRIMLIK